MNAKKTKQLNRYLQALLELGYGKFRNDGVNPYWIARANLDEIAPILVGSGGDADRKVIDSGAEFEWDGGYLFFTIEMRESYRTHLNTIEWVYIVRTYDISGGIVSNSKAPTLDRARKGAKGKLIDTMVVAWYQDLVKSLVKSEFAKVKRAKVILSGR